MGLAIELKIDVCGFAVQSVGKRAVPSPYILATSTRYMDCTVREAVGVGLHPLT
jgi:hypothetical protein